MSGNAGDSLIIRAAKPTVRLKGKQHEYGETQDSDVFIRSGRPETDVMDDDRWLEYPKSSHPTKLIATSAEERTAVIVASEIRNPERLLVWYTTTSDMYRTGEVYRATREEHLAYDLLSRACRVQKDYGHTLWNNIKKALGDSVFKDLSMDSTIQFVFVGISALNCQSVVMVRDDPWDETEAELASDNMKSVTLKTLPEMFPCKTEIIWLETMMIPGNISHVKKALWGRLAGVAKKRFLEVMEREHNLLADGLNPSGVAALLPSNEEHNRKPRFDRSIHHNSDCYNYHYRLRWPPIGLLEIPLDMVEALHEFLFKFSFDNVPLNIAIAAVIIFYDMKKNGTEEDAFLSHNTTSRPQDTTTLAKFIIYFPHMLRFVELNHLTSFIDPMRFAALNCSKDTREGREFRVDPNSLDTTKMSAWYTQIRSKHPQVSSNYRATLIPASMPGTSMVFPLGSDAEKPRPDLFALCCLNDVRTLGVPSYRNINSKHPEFYQRIGGPRSLFTKRLSPPRFKLDASPSVDYWNPENDTKTMALTGRAKRVGPIFPDCDSSYYTKENMTPFINSRFGVSTYYRQNFPLREALATSIRNQTSTMNNELNRIAGYFRVPTPERQVNPGTLLLDWRGIDAHLQALIEKGDLEKVAGGELKRAASPDVPTPRAKRIKTEEHEIDADIVLQINSLIDGLPARSRDWCALEVYLKSGLTPKVQGAQYMLSCVRSFIYDIDVFSTGNSNELVDDLDIFIRMSFRAAGLFDKQQVALLDYETKWAEHREAFSKFGPAIGNAIEIIYRLRGPGGFVLAYPQIKLLRESPLISAQMEAFKKIEDWLEDQAAKTD